jgi:large subunit GTPase 1
LASLIITDVKSTIGFIGYPNVGKSSTLNALAGAKCVAVASTPGKTKHFQTIHLPPLPLVICDCPGLVFPSFATTKADMVTNGILPIDQLRECTGPCALISQRMPQPVLEKIYGIRIRTLDPEGCHETRTPTAPEFLQAYARSRGYTKSGQGNPDESRAARYILKDFVAGKLLFAVPPPGVKAEEFNKGTYTRFLASRSRVSMVNSKILDADHLSSEKELAARGVVEDDVEAEEKKKKDEAEVKDRSVLLDDFIKDKDSYVRVAAGGKEGYSRTKMCPHQNERDSSGYVKVDRTGETSASGKKSHHKGKKNEKKRTKWTQMNDL